MGSAQGADGDHAVTSDMCLARSRSGLTYHLAPMCWDWWWDEEEGAWGAWMKRPDGPMVLREVAICADGFEEITGIVLRPASRAHVRLSLSVLQVLDESHDRAEAEVEP